MPEGLFRGLVLGVAVVFALIFLTVVVPPLLDAPDLVTAAMAGFVNPYAAGYATDAILCWVILAIWVIFEARARGVRHGWVCLLLGIVPGVATGFGLYLFLRTRQLSAEGRA
ncbi:DUF2834 domain-containing protein [uncultured Abyssibacter sp.]|uniref:DUF2834 domain-containing protein n=1 Tax=uncultured Abyssibacter sp. TaxID=2320202 RepID=UPI0032B1F413|tara:strand:+ start:15 stop:350 length:336 start_codon:yes stop_codon:yes gene_type:complete